MPLGDYNLSLRHRDALVKLAGAVIDRKRPLERVGEVMAFNLNTGRADVLLRGGTATITARFSRTNAPSMAHVDDHPEDPLAPLGHPGTRVRVGGSPGSYRIIDVLDGNSPFYDRLSGEISMWAGAAAPSGWLICDGLLYNIGDYPALYALIGTTYGGDGYGLFAVPDLRRRFPRGVGNDMPLASNDGIAQDADRFTSHDHGVATQADHGHSITPQAAPTVHVPITTSGAQNVLREIDFTDHAHGGTTSTNGTHAHGGVTDISAEGDIPFIIINFMIKI